MPRNDPFTQLCRQIAAPRASRADLHVHSLYSDGNYTPAQIVDIARRCGLAAVAVTDHDTCAGVAPTRQAAAGKIEVITGIELTCEYDQHEFHLLGYFFDADNAELCQLLDTMRQARAVRFDTMVQRLEARGVSLPHDPMIMNARGTLGRRHLAEMLVKSKRVANVRQAFQRYLGDAGTIQAPKQRVPVRQGIELIRRAGGVAAWAHPSYHCSQQSLAQLHAWGLDAVEVDFPACKAGRARELRQWAQTLGLAVSGGSDCHGPGSPRNALGSHGVSSEELQKLRERAGQRRAS